MDKECVKKDAAAAHCRSCPDSNYTASVDTSVCARRRAGLAAPINPRQKLLWEQGEQEGGGRINAEATFQTKAPVPARSPWDPVPFLQSRSDENANDFCPVWLNLILRWRNFKATPTNQTKCADLQRKAPINGCLGSASECLQWTACSVLAPRPLFAGSRQYFHNRMSNEPLLHLKIAPFFSFHESL